MLPETGAFELIFLGAVALIVVGPKDLPILMRKVGQFLARMRGMAAEFRASFDELARQSELDDLRKEVEALRNMRLAEPVAPEIVAPEFIAPDLHARVQEVNADITATLSGNSATESELKP